MGDNPKNNRMLDTLTSFRFFAAVLVFIFHVGILTKYQTGYLGVSFFFILSGFILAYSYSHKITSLSHLELKKFYIARLAKIYPIHILTFLLAIPYYFLIPLKHDPILYVFQAFTNILLVQSFIPFGNISFNGVSWSLSDELFFYALFPFFTVISIKCLKSIKWKLIFSFSLWLAIVVLISNVFFENNDFNTWFTYYFPVIRIGEFIVGLMSGLVFLEIKNNFSKFSSTFYSFVEIIAIILLLIIVIISPNFIQNLRYGLIYTPFLAFLIFVFSFQKGFISKLISRRIFIYLGEISFSFYMIHNLVLSYIYFLWKPNIEAHLLITGCFIITLILSSILYHFFEEPMRYKVKNSLSKIKFRHFKEKGEKAVGFTIIIK